MANDKKMVEERPHIHPSLRNSKLHAILPRWKVHTRHARRCCPRHHRPLLYKNVCRVVFCNCARKAMGRHNPLYWATNIASRRSQKDHSQGNRELPHHRWTKSVPQAIIIEKRHFFKVFHFYAFLRHFLTIFVQVSRKIASRSAKATKQSNFAITQELNVL